MFSEKIYMVKGIKSNTLILLTMLLCANFCFALSEQDMQIMSKHGMSLKKIMLQTDKWGVKPSKIDMDGHVFKGQTKNIIDWKMDHKVWLDFEYWKEQRDAKDLDQDWKIQLRQIQHKELVGKVIKCFGVCGLFRGTYRSELEFNTRVYEGDEIITEPDSYVWLVATDGSVIRVSPNTSITFNEVNLGAKDIFYFTRLNYGHVHWQVRKIGKFEEQNLAETDMMFYPLMLKKANREYFSIQEYRKMDHDQRLLYQTRKNPGHITQYEKLNDYLQMDKDKLVKKNTNIFIVSLNSTYYVENGHFDLFSPINGDTKFRFYDQVDGFKNDDPREAKVTTMLRGYNNNEEKILKKNQWYLVPREGKTIETGDFFKQFSKISLFVKRIPTIHLAREIILRDSFQHLLEQDQSAKKFAVDYGYRLWNLDGKEFDNRLKYLKEYTRRVETTNVHSTNKIFKEQTAKDFNSEYYSKGLSEQIFKLKNLYSKKQAIVPELSDIQYYIWILKYGK